MLKQDLNRNIICKYSSLENDYLFYTTGNANSLLTKDNLKELIDVYRDLISQCLFSFEKWIFKYEITMISSSYFLYLSSGDDFKRDELHLMIKIIVDAVDKFIPVVWQSSIHNYLDCNQHWSDIQTKLYEEVYAAINGTNLAMEINVPIILNQELSSQLVHEAFGHTSEADNYIQYCEGSQFQLGHTWANYKLNVYDNPLLSGYRGSYEYDHEGNKAKPTQIIKNGVWNELLYDKKTAEQLGVKHSSNARRTIFSNIIMPRMSVIYLEAGECDIQDIISNIEYGVYCFGTWGGGSLGHNFIIRPSFGKYIKGGKITNEIIRKFDIKGSKFDFISRIDNVSNDLMMFDPYFGCNKNEKYDLPVSQGSPTISVSSYPLIPINDGGKNGR
ncbi:metallopeptidase TldD-related protein [Paenibacillus sp. GCM10012307]|uniref:TldD/PmbA family protein n=1 Tax=Paenibacillus roseus TaxID=2798579 RepID=A0A934J7I8_9BACL|nr:TldD/PmbA family protein [Paenibacillus roseus]MBJ6363199.1 TldD/PmbA family protein [Paenibacillus roseus]